MSSMPGDRDALVAVLDHLDTDLDTLVGFQFDALTTPERLAVLECLERVRRRLPTPEHELINQLAAQATPEDLGGKLPHVLANRLLITRADANRRIGEAADLGDRRTLTGEPLPPVLAATAAAQRQGAIGAGAVAVIRSFVHRLPEWVDAAAREAAEAELARYASQFRPEQAPASGRYPHGKLADRLTDCLNPDGNFTYDDVRREAFVDRVGVRGPDRIPVAAGLRS